jgi:rhodanese-related sulfurtransferase
MSATIDTVLAAARASIDRYAPADAAVADAVIVDLRCGDVRSRTGIIPGSVHVPRSVLEWRCDPGSGYANQELAGHRLILVCEHGYSSSLAAASLHDLGVDAADLEGGFEAWVAAGLPVEPAPPSPAGLPGMGGPE